MDQGELVCDAHDHMADSPAHWAPAHGRRHGGADMHVVLAGERPCRILHASPEWLAEFDFASSEVFGRTLGVIQGPATHGARFVELLRTARWAKQAHGVLVFYARHGQDGAYSVHVQCVGDASDDIAYKLSFTRCDDASWKTATSDDGLAKAVIDAAEPWRAVHVSRELGDLYGLLPEEILGRSLNIVHGPNTDYREWASLLHAGGSGLSPRAVLMTSTRDCRELCVQVTVKPVFGGDSTILHLLLIFSAVDAPELHASRREELQPDPGAPFRVRAQPLPTEGNKWGATTRGTTHTHHQQHHITRLPGEGSMCPDMLSGGARQSGQGLSETGGGGPSGVSSAVSHRLLPMHMPEYAWSPVAEDSQEFARAQEPSLHHLGPAGFAGMQDKGELGHYAAHGHATCRPEAGPPGNFAPVRPVPGRHPRPYLPTFDYTPTPSEHYVPFSVQGSVHSSDGSNGHGLQGSRHVLQRSAHTLQASAHADHARQQMPLAVHAVSEDVGGVGGGAGVFTHRVAHRDVAHRDVRQADAAVHAELQHGNQWLLEARAPLQQQPARAPAGQASAPFPQQPSSMRADAQMGLLPVDAPAPLDMTSLLHMRYGWEMNASLQEQREEAFGIGSEQQGSSHTVIPRRKRKAGASSVATKVKPIKIALDVLDRLSNLSLSQAADSLGISSTAMKKSCRKLGVRRWPYKSDQPSGGKHHIDDAYVRKIQRKYADSLKKGPAPAAAASGRQRPGNEYGEHGMATDDRAETEKQDFLCEPEVHDEAGAPGSSGCDGVRHHVGTDVARASCNS